ncbi:unnamed protein product, partial [Musa acuminata subsp. burmannicoides]
GKEGQESNQESDASDPTLLRKANEPWTHAEAVNRVHKQKQGMVDMSHAPSRDLSGPHLHLR